MGTLVDFSPAHEVVGKEDAERVAQETANAPKKVVLGQLGAHLEDRWQVAKASKVSVEERFLKGLRARRREYSPQMLAALRQMYGAEYVPVYAPIIETKCNAAESWVREIFFQKGERPWDLDPTPMPELPPSILANVEQSVRMALMQKAMMGGMEVETDDELMALEDAAQTVMPDAIARTQKVIYDLAKKSAEQVGKKIEDMFEEGGWSAALSKCIYDIVTFGTMIMKGPIIQRDIVRVRDFNPLTSKWESKIDYRLRENWQRVNPFDMYPLPGTITPKRGDFFEVIHMSRKDISDMLGVPGWDQEAVKNVLRDYRSGGLREWKATDSERLSLEGKESTDLHEDDGIDCLEFHGSAPGSMLRQWGMSRAEVPELEREYDIVAWKIGPHILKAIINQDELGGRPYYTAGFREIPDSFWHTSVPELAESAQSLGNAVFRAISLNIGLAAGPQIEVDIERLAQGEALRIWPNRVWKATNQQLREGQAVNFFQPQIIAAPLMEVFELCLRMADEDTGVPRYAHGDPKTSGAGETSSGLAMLLSQSAKGIKMVVKNIDDGVVAESVEYAYQYLMQYEGNMNVIGDLRAVATGSYALMAREQQSIRRTEFLVNTANPFDMEVLGVKGRAELLRQALKSLDIDPEKVLKDEQELEQMATAMPPSQPPKNDAGMVGAGLPTPDGLTPGAPPPAPAEVDSAAQPVAGRDNQLFQSQAGVTP